MVLSDLSGLSASSTQQVVTQKTSKYRKDPYLHARELSGPSIRAASSSHSPPCPGRRLTAPAKPLALCLLGFGQWVTPAGDARQRTVRGGHSSLAPSLCVVLTMSFIFSILML